MLLAVAPLYTVHHLHYKYCICYGSLWSCRRGGISPKRYLIEVHNFSFAKNATRGSSNLNGEDLGLAATQNPESIPLTHVVSAATLQITVR